MLFYFLSLYLLRLLSKLKFLAAWLFNPVSLCYKFLICQSHIWNVRLIRLCLRETLFLADRSRPLILTFLYRDYQHPISFFDKFDQIIIFLMIKSHKSGNHYHILHLLIVIAVVEELVKTIAWLLSLTNKQKVVFYFLARCHCHVIDSQPWDFLDEVVKDGEILEQTDEKA